jgi:hypothetical protein
MRPQPEHRRLPEPLGEGRGNRAATAGTPGRADRQTGGPTQAARPTTHSTLAITKTLKHMALRPRTPPRAPCFLVWRRQLLSLKLLNHTRPLTEPPMYCLDAAFIFRI